MPLTPNPAVILTKRIQPDIVPVPGEHLIVDKSRSIDLDNVPLNGGFLTKSLYLSPEPYLLERMRNIGPETASFITSYTLGVPITAFALVVVLRSEKEGFKPGDILYGHTTWEAYTVQPYVEGRIDFKPEDWPPMALDIDHLPRFTLRVVPNPEGAFALSNYCSAIGTPGMTAYLGIEGVLSCTPGKTIWISAGASGVGAVAIQLAKLRGLTVIASASTDDRLEYMKSLGADYVFNYKTEGYEAALKRLPRFDLFWDNINGQVLEIAMQYIAPFGEILCCGGSSENNIPWDQRHGIKNAGHIFRKRLRIFGFIISDPDLDAYVEKFFEEMPKLIRDGKVKVQDHIFEGWDGAPQAFVDTIFGSFPGTGKPLIHVGDP